MQTKNLPHMSISNTNQSTVLEYRIGHSQRMTCELKSDAQPIKSTAIHTDAFSEFVLKMQELWSFKIWRTTYPMTQHHIPEQPIF